MALSDIIRDNINSLNYFLPELLLTGLVLIMIIADLLLKKERSPWMSIIALIGSGIVLFAIINQYDLGSRSIFNNMLAVDPFSIFFKLLFVASTILVIFLSIASVELSGRNVGEYFTLLMILTLGLFLMASATHMVTIFISIELVSIVSFALVTYLKTRRRSSEAGLKYAIYGAFSSGLMLYGISILYGLTGTLNIYEIGEVLAGRDTNSLALLISVLLIMAGLGYKIASVPFHFWAPDVYEGAPTPITAFLSIGPKAAGFALLIRFFNVALSNYDGVAEEWLALSNINWPQIIAVIAAATMTLGNLVAIMQDNVKRLLAYSSIAHAGYALLGVVVLSSQGVYATLFYLVVYSFMNLGAFLIVIIFQDIIGSEKIDDFKGLVYRAPIPAIAMGVFLFSLTGLPPTAGFIGKFYLFAALIKAGPAFYWLAIVGLLNSVVALYYYARILKVMFFDKVPEGVNAEPLKVSPYYITLLAILGIPTILVGLYWAPLADLASHSVHFLQAF